MDCDVTWVKMLKRSSREAFERIYERYADKVYRVASRMYLPAYEAEEIVQEVFLALWEQRTSLKEDLSLNAYLLSITRNKVITLQKKKVADIARSISWQREQPAYDRNAEDLVVFKDMESHTLRFIDGLPPRNKQIFMLSRLRGLRNEEIAKTLQLSRRTVENNLYQAEKAIHQFLRKSRFILKTAIVVLLTAI